MTPNTTFQSRLNIPWYINRPIPGMLQITSKTSAPLMDAGNSPAIMVINGKLEFLNTDFHRM